MHLSSRYNNNKLHHSSHFPHILLITSMSADNENGVPAHEEKDLDKHEQFQTDDGLDQEIQRALALHDLEQRNQHHHNEESHEPLEGHPELLSPHEPNNPSSQQEHNLDQSSAHENEMHNSSENYNDTQYSAEDKASEMNTVSEKLDLQMIAEELKRATSSVPEERGSQAYGETYSDYSQPAEHNENSKTHLGDAAIGFTKPPAAAHIPAGSELLATNTALAAYNALSSHVPPVALLANVHLTALPLPIVAPDYLPARIQLLINTLPVLDNLASQLLRVFAAGPYQKIIDLASSPETPSGAAFRDLTSLFEFTKRLYSEEEPFLNVEHLAPGIWKEGDVTPSVFRSREQTIESTLRKVNLATFLAATLGTIEVGFFHLNESFLPVFCPANTLDPTNSMSNMSFTNINLQSGVNTVIGDKVGKILKSQAVLYLDLKTQAFISAVEAGERSSQEILDDIFPANIEEAFMERRGVKSLSPTEMDFVNRCRSRKDILLNFPAESSLSEEYEWFSFLRDLFDFVSKNMSFLIWGKKGKAPVSRAERLPTASESTPHLAETLKSVSTNITDRSEHNTSTSDPTGNQEINDITAALLPSEIQEQQIHVRMGVKAPSRRPWTRDEEKALRHALELKGPLWSTILELFGQGGRINESLKNRTQVQLKDKARNWKMFFLKSGLPVPAYLQKVTGDLEREDKLRAKNARNRKTAAAPVPNMSKREGAAEESTPDPVDDARKKRRKV